MTFSQWLFGGIDNPAQANQWGALHIATLVVCITLILGFYFTVKRAKNKDRARKIIICSLAGVILFFEIMIRFVYCVKLYHFNMPEMAGLNLFWIMIPKPWCAISCWALVACVFVKKPFFYNFAAQSALICSFIFFCYPGVGYNNVYMLFENWYSILTHALQLIMSITLIELKYTDFKYKNFPKTAICFVVIFVYAFLEVFVLKVHADPMYFMPGGDIQANILKIDYGWYLVGYVALIITYLNAPYLIKLVRAKRRGARIEKAAD